MNSMDSRTFPTDVNSGKHTAEPAYFPLGRLWCRCTYRSAPPHKLASPRRSFTKHELSSSSSRDWTFSSKRKRSRDFAYLHILYLHAFSFFFPASVKKNNNQSLRLLLGLFFSFYTIFFLGLCFLPINFQNNAQNGLTQRRPHTTRREGG